MQKFIVKDIKPSTREKQPTKIITEDGSELSGFHASLKTLTPGTEFEANTEVNKGYVNIVGEVKVISLGPVQSNGYDMSKEDWKEKNRIERESIEAQVAYKGIIDLACSKIITIDNTYYGKALEWAGKCLDRALKVQPSKVYDVTTHGDKERRQIDAGNGKEVIGPPFKDAGDFWTKASKRYGKTQSELCVILSIKKPSDITDFDWAWMELEKNLTSA